MRASAAAAAAGDDAVELMLGAKLQSQQLEEIRGALRNQLGMTVRTPFCGRALLC